MVIYLPMIMFEFKYNAVALAHNSMRIVGRYSIAFEVKIVSLCWLRVSQVRNKLGNQYTLNWR